MARGHSSIAENLARVRERIERAAARAGRSAGEITVVAVSKTFPAEAIQEAYAAGVRHFGENRVQEWESKQAHVPSPDAVWHLVGHLQSNKAARAVKLFHTVDSLDSLDLARRLDRAVAGNTEQTKTSRLRVLIEVRLDPTPAKSGVSDAELPALVDGVLELPHLDLQGLMGVPPPFGDAERVRPEFRRLRELRDAAAARAGLPLPILSMGMSHDFEVAVEEGATEVRIGTAVFGARKIETA
jgi:PLP dependent protein